MEYLSTDKILIVDLGTSEITEDELDEDLVAEKIGGAGITKHLYREYESENPIVIGTGLLTGTLYPASALGMITAESPVTGNVCHSPITMKVGTEIKYAGFDYIVIKGTSEKPVYLWIHDGVADITDAQDVWGKDVWETTDAWRKRVGDDLLQTMVIGKAGETGSDFAQVCFNYWAGTDRWGFGKLFGRKNFKGLAMRGMGLLEVAEPEEFADKCAGILSEVKNGAFAGKKGIAEICAAIGEEDVKDWLAPLIHRHSACYNTPYAANTFVFLDDDPGLLKESETKEPGFLVTDVYGLLGFKKAGLSAEDSCRMLKACAKYGIDPAAVAELSQKAGKKTVDEIQDSLAELSGSAAIPGKGVFSPWCPIQPVFDNFGLSPEETEIWWETRQATAYIFGIHPIFAVMSPELTRENMLELANVGTELELTRGTLDKVIADLCG
ncbi:MAG: hypothetical protein GY795_08920 [Desulfobacterales bacterium]|nr:hypothetical protein [Desulfobacterales bacterium]